MSEAPEVLTFHFGDAGAFPNNPHLPAVIYKHVHPPAPGRDAEAIAHWFEQTWSQHRWRPAWRWGVYDFAHYHSTAHEILGVFRGHASLRLGDRAGVIVVVEPGDALVLPAGTAHQNLGASADFQVVGGYPRGQQTDLMRGRPDERPAADKRIAKVSLPITDPFYGDAGPLEQEWRL